MVSQPRQTDRTMVETATKDGGCAEGSVADGSFRTAADDPRDGV
eukprot:gene10947-biopygen9301